MSKIGKFKKLLQNAVDIARYHDFDITVESIMSRWGEPHRHWHTPDHLRDMLEGIEEILKENKITKREYDILVIAAIFHDIIYDPKRNDNEEKSVDYMMSVKPPCLDKNIAEEKAEFVEEIVEVILDTKTHESKNALSRKFNKLDTWILDAPFIDMLDWENKIYKEFKWAGWKQYKKGRIQFLLSCIKSHTHNVINIKNLIDYIEKKVPKVGVCYYEIDKLPLVNEYIDKNNKINNLFDIIIVVIVYNKENYSKEKIKEYGICSDYEFVALQEDSFFGYISKQEGITIVKDLKLMKEYNKDIEEQLNSKLGDFRTIYL